MTEEIQTRDGKTVKVSNGSSWWRGIATTVLLGLGAFLAQQLWQINERLARVEQRLDDLESGRNVSMPLGKEK